MKKSLFIALSFVLIIGSSAFVVNNNDKLFEITKNIEIFTNLYKELNTSYVDQLDPDKLMKTGIDAMMHSLDPYTRYYSENQIERYRFLTEGKYQGIGANVAKVGDHMTIIEAYKGFAAHNAGLKAGDKIIEVEGENVVGKAIDEVRNMLRGVSGTEMTLTVQSYGQKKKREVLVTRSEVNKQNVPYSGMLDNEIGYVVLTTFTRNASGNISSAIKEMKKSNPEMKGLVLDLRNNGGGLLLESVNICNLFVDKGQELVVTKGKIKAQNRPYKTLNAPLDLEIPLVVLINKRSASASEIVSGVLQDLDRAVVMGQRSFGKGLVQNTRQLGYNNNMKLTTAKYYIPSGRCIQAVKYKDGAPVDIPDSLRATFYTANGRKVLDGGGVRPDIVLERAEDPAFLKGLLKQHIIFNYINEYTMDIDSIESAKEFTFTDYQGFKNFVEKQDFKYSTEAENQLKKLKTGDVSSAISDQIETLEGLILKDKKGEIDKYKSLIIDEIEEQIVTRYHFEKGKFEHKLDDDTELDAAIALLKDQSKYQAVFQK